MGFIIQIRIGVRNTNRKIMITMVPLIDCMSNIFLRPHGLPITNSAPLDSVALVN